MAWIDFLKAYDSVPHDWFLECSKFFGIHKNINICSLIAQFIRFWRTTLTFCGVVLGDTEIHNYKNIPGS